MRIRLILSLPLVLLLVLFALSNRMVVPIGLWPTGVTIDTPVSVAILMSMALAFVAGALLIWMDSLSHRRRARRAEKRIVVLLAELDRLKTKSVVPPR